MALHERDAQPGLIIQSPRSLEACKLEGILPEELCYKPIEAFAEKNLSPRLVKLRFDFFEAKRKDLLLCATHRRHELINEQGEKSQNGSLEQLARATGVTMSQIVALNSDGLQLERKKLLRAQQMEKAWLRGALGQELKQLELLDQNDKKLTRETEQANKQQAQAADMVKQLNDERQKEEERRQRELEAQMRLEKAIARQEFAKQQEELERQKERDQEKKRLAYQRELEENERKRAAEVEKERKRQEAWDEQQRRAEELKMDDMRRAEVLEKQRLEMQQRMFERKETRDLRIAVSIANNEERQNERRRELENKMRDEQLREERLAEQRALEQEESAKHSFQVLVKRKTALNDANRKLEERKRGFLEQQDKTEARLLEHELKRERYLDFKRELDGLKVQNKEMNVERQRRREESRRDRLAEQARLKNEKMDTLKNEKARLWDLRRMAQLEGNRQREAVKKDILNQRLKSKFDPASVRHKIQRGLDSDIFSSSILGKSTSLPSIRSPSA